MDDFASAATVFANTDGGTGAINFAIFAQIYTAIFGPFHNAATSVSAALSGTAAGWVTAGVVVLVMVATAAMALQYEGIVFDRLLTRVLIPAAISLFILRGHYQEFVLDPATTFTAQVATSLTGNIGGTSLNGGAPFDALWNKAVAAAIAAWTHLPSSILDVKSWVGAFLIGIFVLCSGAAIGVSFVLFLASQVALYMVLAIGPLFIAFGAGIYTRFLLKGWISVVASILCTQVLVLALLGLTMKVEDTIISPLLTAAANQNLWGMVTGLMVVGVVLFCCAWLAFKASEYAAGICGGVVDSGASWVGMAARGVAAARGGVAGAASAASAATTSTHRTHVAGRNLSGP